MNNIQQASNIQDAKKIEAELIKAKEKAERADRLKSAFLANMSHEIRTPMNAILGFVQLLDDDELEKDKRQKYISIIDSNGKQLLQLINDIIDIARIESNHVEIKYECIDLHALLKELYSIFVNLPAIKHNPDIELIVDNDVQESCWITTDKTRLKQILSNLLSNAIKFTHNGTVAFGYSYDNEWLNFYVEDTGIGISEEKQQYIFERFTQDENYLTKNFRGTGLGLAISKGLVKLMNGDIWLDSEIDKGTTFFLKLPYIKGEKVMELENYAETAYFWKDKTVLIVEDEKNNYLYLRELLIPTGIKTVKAITSDDVIIALDEHPEIDIILLDINIPGKTGYELVKDIKRQYENIPVIAQTAYALAGDREKYINAGFDDYVSKPLDQSELLRKMNRYLSKTKNV